MTEEQAKPEDVVLLMERMAKARFCKNKCPIEKKTWACGSRPLKYMKECPILKAYNKKNKRKVNAKK